MSRSTQSGRYLASVWSLALLAAAACGPAQPEDPRSESPSAQWDIVQTLREDLASERHEADGGGTVRIIEEPEARPIAGATARWSFEYETGPLGIAEGGWIFFQAPPFWGWSTPQVSWPEGAGYTLVTTDAAGVELAPATVDQQLLAIGIQGRALAPGETVRIVYGAGEAGAVVDSYAERRSRFWFAVDGDGDGIRSTLEDRLFADIGPGPAARLVVTMPSTARPGESARLNLVVLDVAGNSGVPVEGSLVLESLGGPLSLPVQVDLEPEDSGRLSIEIPRLVEGVYRVAATGEEGLAGISGESNPLVVSREGHEVLWGDLHGHSGFSDGTGTPHDYFLYARDVARLDVAALTDHDHWGMQPLALHPEVWEEIRSETSLFNEPGHFVTLLGYEWTSWIHGHRHVLYFEGEGEVFSSIDPAYETPQQLWGALRGTPALTFAHHSAGGPIATNWEFPPDPELEPVTEIVSVHGSSEAEDTPARIYSALSGNFVRDVLGTGVRLGFIGSGDTHDGHPGLGHLTASSGGLAAILSTERSREGVLEALRSRRVYATNGPRIVLRVSLGGRRMGDTIPAVAAGVADTDRAGSDAEVAPADELRVVVVAPGELERIDIIRSSRDEESVGCMAQTICSFTRRLAPLEPGEFVYIRAVQMNGGAAWSSPFFVE